MATKLFRSIPGLLYAGGVLLILGGALSGGGRLLEAHPGFCISCHEMKYYGRTFQSSGAAKHHPDCIMCHSGAGVTGAVAAQMDGLHELAIHFWGTPRPARQYVAGVVPNENCIKCHVHGYDRDAHQGVPIRGRACAQCHNHYAEQDFGGQVPFDQPVTGAGKQGG